MREHTHVVNAAVSGLSALPGTARTFAAVRAMTRFLNNERIPFHALIEPAQDAARAELKKSDSRFVLVVHDWSMFQFHTHRSKKDRLQRTHAQDLGYDLGTALLVDAADGRPLGVMEARLRTGEGMLSTRIRDTAMPPGHIDELADVMRESQGWQLDRVPIHVIDREADSVGHYRAWSLARHRFLVRVDNDRIVMWEKKECKLRDVMASSSLKFVDVLDLEGVPEVITIREGTGRIRVAETEIVLHRPAKKIVSGERTASGAKKKIEVPGEPLHVRLVVTRVVNEVGKVIAEWCLLSNVLASEADAAELGRWYAWRWRIETFHRQLKTSGMNAEEWQQETGAAFLRRLCVVLMACLTVWHLQRDPSDEAKKLREFLVRLSGRQMKHRVESTFPALLAGLEKLLSIDNALGDLDLQEMLDLARKLLPKLFKSG